MTERKRLTTNEKYPHGAEGVSENKLTGRYCRGVFEATACIEKLAEYETAEEEGRLVVLPCKVGTRVHEIYQFCGCGAWEIEEHKIKLEDLDKIGKTVFLTREEAEKALKEMEVK